MGETKPQESLGALDVAVVVADDHHVILVPGQGIVIIIVITIAIIIVIISLITPRVVEGRGIGPINKGRLDLL